MTGSASLSICNFVTYNCVTAADDDGVCVSVRSIALCLCLLSPHLQISAALLASSLSRQSCHATYNTPAPPPPTLKVPTKLCRIQDLEKVPTSTSFLLKAPWLMTSAHGIRMLVHKEYGYQKSLNLPIN